MHNELYVLCHQNKGTMIGRLAFKTKQAAEEYIKSKKYSSMKYRIERYLPEASVVVCEHEWALVSAERTPGGKRLSRCRKCGLREETR